MKHEAGNKGFFYKCVGSPGISPRPTLVKGVQQIQTTNSLLFCLRPEGLEERNGPTEKKLPFVYRNEIVSADPLGESQHHGEAGTQPVRVALSSPDPNEVAVSSRPEGARRFPDGETRCLGRDCQSEREENEPEPGPFYGNVFLFLFLTLSV